MAYIGKTEQPEKKVVNTIEVGELSGRITVACENVACEYKTTVGYHFSYADKSGEVTDFAIEKIGEQGAYTSDGLGENIHEVIFDLVKNDFSRRLTLGFSQVRENQISDIAEEILAYVHTLAGTMHLALFADDRERSEANESV